MSPTVVFFDGQCDVCRWSRDWLDAWDWWGRLEWVDVHTAPPESRPPGATLQDLKAALHLMTPGGQVFTGFLAFRWLAWRLPALWLIAPFLYLPGARPLGERLYRWIALHRHFKIAS